MLPVFVILDRQPPHPVFFQHGLELAIGLLDFRASVQATFPCFPAVQLGTDDVVGKGLLTRRFREQGALLRRQQPEYFGHLCPGKRLVSYGDNDLVISGGGLAVRQSGERSAGG